MANYYASARSNYFKVKDAEAFRAWASDIPGIGVWTKEDCFAIYDDGGDSNGWPSYKWVKGVDEDGNETEEDGTFDLAEELSEHLQEGEVAVLIEVGAEKLRYLCGHAVVVNWKGEIESLNLNRIYDLYRRAVGYCAN